VPEIAPFRGVRFNPAAISCVARVVAPPYDVIDPDLEKELTERDEHNIVRLTMGKTPPEGRSDEDYQRAAALLATWRRDGVLVKDDAPAIYIVEQTFNVGGEVFVRRGFIAAVKLEEFGQGNVYPHERTMDGPRSDRLRLMQACRGNLSQVLAMYSDPDGAADRLVGSLVGGELLYQFRDDGPVDYAVWRVTARGPIGQLADLMRERALFIADGHHRYESALRYRSLERRGKDAAGPAPQDFIAALCISAANPGLKILPTHRCIKRAPTLRKGSIGDALSPHFAVTGARVSAATDLQATFDQARRGEACVGCYLAGKQLLLLKPVDVAPLRPRFPERADAWWKLPVSMLHYVILPDLVGIAPGSREESQDVEYRHDATVLRDGVEDGTYAAGFLLPPTDAAVLEHVASQGERLPQKSTYFYPKIASGLVLYLHEPGTL